MPASKLLAVSYGKRIEGRVAKNPKAQDDKKHHPDILCVESVSVDRLITHYRVCMAQQHVEQEWQRDDHERVEFESCDHVTVQQRMHSARATATRTGKACQQPKRASWEKARAARFENEYINRPRCQSQPDKKYRQATVNYLIKSHETLEYLGSVSEKSPYPN